MGITCFCNTKRKNNSNNDPPNHENNIKNNNEIKDNKRNINNRGKNKDKKKPNIESAPPVSISTINTNNKSNNLDESKETNKYSTKVSNLESQNYLKNNQNFNNIIPKEKNKNHFYDINANEMLGKKKIINNNINTNEMFGKKNNINNNINTNEMFEKKNIINNNINTNEMFGKKNNINNNINTNEMFEKNNNINNNINTNETFGKNNNINNNINTNEIFEKNNIINNNINRNEMFEKKNNINNNINTNEIFKKNNIINNNINTNEMFEKKNIINNNINKNEILEKKNIINNNINTNEINYPFLESSNNSYINNNSDDLDFNIKNEYKNLCYDVIIDIKSIQNLNQKGWNIIYSGKKENKKEMVKNRSKIIISVFGNSNRGKTYLLQKLSGENLESGYQIQTKGLSMKFHGSLIYLDTAGTNTPLLLEDNMIRPNEAELQKIHLCQIITNYIIQKYVVEHADILLCVIGMLNSAEQIFLQKIKKLCENKKKLIVIHNLIKCETSEDIEKYKNETLLQMISNQLVEKPIPNFSDKYENLFNKFFIEKGNPHIKHFIYANDEKKSEEINYYNKTTLDYIKILIKMEKEKKKNLLELLIKHIKYISSCVLQKEITPEIEEKTTDLIKCKENEEIIPKDIKADELDNMIFIGKEFQPLYRYYKRGKYFIIEIQLCSQFYEFEKEY